MKRILITLTITAAVSGSAFGFFRSDGSKGQTMSVPEGYSKQQLEQQQGQGGNTAALPPAPVKTDNNFGTPAVTDDQSAAGNLSTSMNHPNTTTDVNGQQVLQTVEGDLQKEQSKRWWKTPLLFLLCAGLGMGAFYGFTRWTAKAVEATQNQPVKTR